MKRLSLFALPLALLALGGCDNNENVPNGKPQEVGITPKSEFRSVSTRGYTVGSAFDEISYERLIDAAATPSDRLMTVSSYLVPQHGESKAYFTKKTFKNDGSGFWRNYNGETPDPIMWPIGGKLSFLAISTTEGFSLGNALWNNDNPTNSVEFDVTAENCTQNDILYAGKYDVASKQENGNVDMTFRHAQAWLTFRLTGDMNGDKSIVHFKKIELEQAYNAGKLSVHRNGDDVLAEWTLNPSTASKVPVDNKRTRKVEDLTMTPQQLDMLVPQQQNCAFTLYYSMGIDTEVNDYRFELPSGTWFMGQHYIYNIHITATEITVVPTVEPWGESRCTTLSGDMLSAKAIGGATVGKIMINGQEYDPMRFYREDEVLKIVAKPNNDGEKFRWEDSTTINNDTITVKAKELMEHPCHVLFYTDDVIPFAYSVGDGKKVYFASGNLYCTDNGESETPRYTFDFEEKQYYFRTRPNQGCYLRFYDEEEYYNVYNGTPEYTSGMFQWVSKNASDKDDNTLASFGAFSELTPDKLKGNIKDTVDFGPAMGEGWTTLNKEQMVVLNSSHIGMREVNSTVDGSVFKPDGFVGEIDDSYDWDTNNSGLVFLPAVGHVQTQYAAVHDVGDFGLYWSSSSFDEQYAHYFVVCVPDVYVFQDYRDICCAVRLVWPAE